MMRSLVTFLFLLALSGVSQATTCTDGRPDIGEGCATNIESITFSAVGEDGFTATVDLDLGPAGSLYTYTSLIQEPPGCSPGTSASDYWLCADYASIKAGSGALVKKTQAGVDGTQNAVFTDLPCGETIYTLAWHNGTFGEFLQPSKPLVASQATSSCSGGGGGEEPDLDGQVYVFDEANGSCSDLNDGQTNPWCSTAALSGFSVPGADFLFMDDGVYDESIDAPVSGVSASNLSRYSTGYVNTTTGKLLWYEQGDFVGRGAMAKFNGDINPAQRTAGTVNYNASPSIITSEFDATFRIDQKDYIEVSYLDFQYSFGSFIGISGSSPMATGTANHHIIKENNFYISGFTPITIVNGAQNVAVLNNTSEFGSDCERQERTGGTIPSPAVATCGRAGWPGAFVVWARSPNTQSIAAGNRIQDGRGEGLNCLNNTSYLVFQGNWTDTLLSNGQYFDGCAFAIAEHNLNMSGGDGEMVVNVENSVAAPPTSDELIFRNNISVGVNTCVTVRMQSSKQALGEELKIEAWHNTCIATSRDINFMAPSANIVTGSEAIGNLFGAISLTSTNRSTFDIVGPNHFGISPSDTDLQDGSNTTGDPLFVTAEATLLSATVASPIDETDVALGGGTPVGNAPLALVTSNGIDDPDDYGDFVFDHMTVLTIDTPAKRAKWQKKAKYCYDGTERSDSVASKFGAVCN